MQVLVQHRYQLLLLKGIMKYYHCYLKELTPQGSKLSKYQIYAATWIIESYKISENLKDLVKFNRDRYNDMLDNGIMLDDYDPVKFMKKMSLNTFEIAYGFGKYLTREWPYLFGDSKQLMISIVLVLHCWRLVWG